MAKCKNCKHLCTMQNYKKESYKWCSLIDDCPQEDIERNCDFYVPMTNADRIRSMTDEELASFLKEVKEDYQWTNPDYPDCDDCGEWLEWIQSEAEEAESEV